MVKNMIKIKRLVLKRLVFLSIIYKSLILEVTLGIDKGYFLRFNLV